MNILKLNLLVIVYSLAGQAQGAAAFDKLPAKIQVVCESRESGRVEAVLTKPPTPIYASDELSEYSMDLKRFDPQTGALVASVFYPADPLAKEYASKLWLNNKSFDVVHEPVIRLMVPAVGVDWTEQGNKNRCYVNAPLPGLEVNFGVYSGKTRLQGYSEASLETTEVNPGVELSITPGPGFGTAQDILNGRPCRGQRQYVRNPHVMCNATVLEIN